MSGRRHLSGWIQLALLLLFLGFVAIVISEFARPGQFVDAYVDAQWYWALGTPIIFIVYFLLNGLLYRLSFQAVGVKTTTRHIIPVMLASIFVNTVIPVGGAGAAALFVEDAAETGQSGSRALAGVMLVLVADLGTMIPFVAVGLVYLYVRDRLAVYDTVASALFVLIVILFMIALWLAKVREAWLEVLLARVRRLVNRLGGLFRRPGLLQESWVSSSAQQFSYATVAITKNRGRLAQVLLLITFLHFVSMAGLFAIFMAFHHRVGFGVLFAGFSMSVVYYVVAITPQGFGAVEGVMTLVLKSLGISSALAVEAATAYRLFSVWLPLVCGYFFARRLPIFRGQRPRVARTTEGTTGG